MIVRLDLNTILTVSRKVKVMSNSDTKGSCDLDQFEILAPADPIEVQKAKQKFEKHEQLQPAEGGTSSQTKADTSTHSKGKFLIRNWRRLLGWFGRNVPAAH